PSDRLGPSDCRACAAREVIECRLPFVALQRATTVRTRGEWQAASPAHGGRGRPRVDGLDAVAGSVGVVGGEKCSLRYGVGEDGPGTPSHCPDRAPPTGCPSSSAPYRLRRGGMALSRGCVSKSPERRETSVPGERRGGVLRGL